MLPHPLILPFLLAPQNLPAFLVQLVWPIEVALHPQLSNPVSMRVICYLYLRGVTLFTELTFDEVKFVLVVCSIVYILHQQGLSLLALRYLGTYSTKVLYEQFCCLGHEHQSLLAHILVVIIHVYDLPYSIHWQSHKFSYRINRVTICCSGRPQQSSYAHCRF